MKKKYIKYLLLTSIFIISIIIYLSAIGLNTEKFNNQIKEKVNKTDKNLEIELKKIRLTLDPINFKINAKTIGSKLKLKDKIIELETIKTQISLNSLINNKFSLSNLKISTKPTEIKNLIFLYNLFRMFY